MKTRREKILRKPGGYQGGIPQYSLGGILMSTATGAGTGALSGAPAGGLGAVPGAIIGGAIGLGSGLFAHFQERKAEKAEEEQNKMMANASVAAMSGQGSINNFMNPWLAAKGVVLPDNKLVKLRNKELVIDPSGKTKTSEQMGAKTPQHTNKGIVALRDGSVVVSPENSPEAKRIARKQKPEVDKWTKILNNPRSTVLARKTAERRLGILKKAYDPVIMADAQRRMAEGGTATGGEIPEANAGWIQGAQMATQLAPVLYNMGQGMRKTQKLNPALFQNPMAYAALDTMRNRRADYTPAIQATDQAVAAGNTNLRDTATGRGQYAAGRIALTNAGMTNKANIYSQASRDNQGYLGEYGGMQANIGQRMADTNLMVQDLNDRNAAAGRNYGAAAMGQLSQWSQVQQQMANQAKRDETLGNSIKGFMELFGVTPTGKTGGTANFNTGGIPMPAPYTLGMYQDSQKTRLPQYSMPPLNMNMRKSPFSQDPTYTGRNLNF